MTTDLDTEAAAAAETNGIRYRIEPVKCSGRRKRLPIFEHIDVDNKQLAESTNLVLNWLGSLSVDPLDTRISGVHSLSVSGTAEYAGPVAQPLTVGVWVSGQWRSQKFNLETPKKVNGEHIRPTSQ